jgi:hypothetical protein
VRWKRSFHLTYIIISVNDFSFSIFSESIVDVNHIRLDNTPCSYYGVVSLNILLSVAAGIRNGMIRL